MHSRISSCDEVNDALEGVFRLTEQHRDLLDQDAGCRAYCREHQFSLDRDTNYIGRHRDFRQQRPAEVDVAIQATLRRQVATISPPTIFRGTILRAQAPEWYPQPAPRSHATSGVQSIHARNVSGQQTSLSRSTSDQLSTHSRQASGQQGGRSRARSTQQTLVPLSLTFLLAQTRTFQLQHLPRVNPLLPLTGNSSCAKNGTSYHNTFLSPDPRTSRSWAGDV